MMTVSNILCGFRSCETDLKFCGGCFLTDGVIWIMIDDNEGHYLKVIVR